MSTSLIRVAVHSRLSADTGSGGLYETGAPILSAPPFFEDAGDNPVFPFIVMNITMSQSDADDARITDFSLDVDVYLDRESGGVAVAEAIRDRLMGDWSSVSNGLPTYGLDRWQPTLLGHGVGLITYVSSIPSNQPGVIHHVHRFRGYVSQEYTPPA